MVATALDRLLRASVTLVPILPIGVDLALAFEIALQASKPTNQGPALGAQCTGGDVAFQLGELPSCRRHHWGIALVQMSVAALKPKASPTSRINTGQFFAMAMLFLSARLNNP